MNREHLMGWPAARLVQMAFEEDCAMEQMLRSMHEATLRAGPALRPWALGIPERITAQQRAVDLTGCETLTEASMRVVGGLYLTGSDKDGIDPRVDANALRLRKCMTAGDARRMGLIP